MGYADVSYKVLTSSRSSELSTSSIAAEFAPKHKSASDNISCNTRFPQLTYSNNQFMREEHVYINR